MENQLADEQQPSSELTPQYAADLLVHSFAVSQGNPNFQLLIFRYLHLEYPQWRIRIEEAETILKKANRQASSFVFAAQRRPELNTSPYKLHSLTMSKQREKITSLTVSSELEDQLKYMRMIFNEDFREDPGNLINPQSRIFTKEQTLNEIGFLTEGMDKYYRNKGREFSYYQAYVLGDEPYRISAYDSMFSEIRKVRHPDLPTRITTQAKKPSPQPQS